MDLQLLSKKTQLLILVPVYGFKRLTTISSHHAVYYGLQEKLELY